MNVQYTVLSKLANYKAGYGYDWILYCVSWLIMKLIMAMNVSWQIILLIMAKNGLCQLAN
jgi:hypothetical protein